MNDNAIFKKLNGPALRKFVGLSRTDELIKKVYGLRLMSYAERQKVIEFLDLLAEDIQKIKNLLK